MRPALPALAVLLVACNHPERQTVPAAEALERDLRTPTTAPTVDTAAQRKAAEWQRCLYVYHDQPDAKIRECLVIQYKWEPALAERRLTLFVDSMARAVDSLRRLGDSLARAERRRQDSIYLATHQERLDGAPVAYDSGLAVMWVADKRTGAYYRTDCEKAKRIPVSARDFYMYEEDARQAHRWPSRRAGCVPPGR